MSRKLNAYLAVLSKRWGWGIIWGTVGCGLGSTCMQACKHASMQACKHASMQACKHASMQACEYASLQACEYGVCKHASM